LLRVAPAWTVRLAFPHHLEHFYSACQAVIRDELESPLHPATIGELQSFFEHRRQSENGEPLHAMTRGFVNVGYKVFGDGVDIRIIQLMLGHASVQQTQRYLNVTDEELRRGLEVSWKRRTLKAVSGGQNV
jgi:integrase